MEEKVATGDVTERAGKIGSHTETGSARMRHKIRQCVRA